MKQGGMSGDTDQMSQPSRVLKILELAAAAVVLAV